MRVAQQFNPAALRTTNTIRRKNAERVAIGHALVDACTFEEARSSILAHAIARGGPAYIITPNAQHIVLLNDDIRLREIYRHADLVVPDGISLLLASRVFHHRLPERVTGVDLFQSLCADAAAAKLKVFFLGGLPSSADLAASKLRERFPGLNVETYCPPFGFEHDPAELDHIANRIRAAQPSFLFVGLGAPKQDYWIFNHGRPLGVSVMMGIGGSFEMVGGLIRRAPTYIRRMGSEWLYRFCKEPRRTWRRYFFGNARFIQIVFKQWLKPTVFASPSNGKGCAEPLEITTYRSP